METKIVLIVLIVVILVILARCVRVVQQSKAYVIERLGAFHTVWSFISRFPSLTGFYGWSP